MRVGFDRVKVADMDRDGAGRALDVDLPVGAVIVNIEASAGWLNVFWYISEEKPDITRFWKGQLSG